MTVLLMLLVASVQGAIVDTYEETFDDEADEATIDGVDNWSVDQGAATDAITQNDATYTGSGKSLQLTGAETAANVSRTATYGEASPCWVEFKIRPALGGQTQTIPSGKIAAVTFDHKGKIYASDGSSWTDTGATFSADEWYTVVMKLDFGSHLYDIYIEPTASPEAEFIPDKENLNFIDSSISYINKLGFDGVYSATQSSDETYIDDLIVHFIDRIEIISAQQTLAVDQPSSPITAQLQNSYSEPQTAWEDIQLELRSTSDGGEFSLDRDNWSAVSVVTLPENAWQIIFYYKDTKRGKPIITVNEYPDSGWEEASQQSEI
ncbi:MAG: hypothetical protein ISS34_06300, partial [Candidatus Omnitrophica bacterium]|nr:hypothetical protein [Candidatus Omnitrophota bacterium]